MTQSVQLWHLEEAVSDKLTSVKAEAGIPDPCVCVCGLEQEELQDAAAIKLTLERC